MLVPGNKEPAILPSSVLRFWSGTELFREGSFVTLKAVESFGETLSVPSFVSALSEAPIVEVTGVVKDVAGTLEVSAAAGLGGLPNPLNGFG